MKKSDALRLKTRKMIAKNIIILVVLAVVAFVGAYSWFTIHQQTTAGGVDVSTKVNDKLEFYIMPPSGSDQYSAINSRLRDNATWNNDHPSETRRQTEWNEGELNFDFSDQQLKFMDGLFMSEVTGNGTTFNIPKLMQYDQIAYVDTTQSFEAAVANDNYMSFDLYFRSKHNYSIALTRDSKIEPVNGNSLSGQHVYNGDTDEASMKPGAIGAVRMSVLNCEANNERELLWIPAPNVWYDGLNDRLYTGLTANGTSPYDFNHGSAYYTGSAIAERQNEHTTDHAFYSSASTRVKWENGTYNVIAGTDSSYQYQLRAASSTDIVVVTLPHRDTANDYYYGHIRVNLWIEGEDSEARLRLVNGKINMSLNFDIVEAVSG